ncbi:MAG TPA: hypothetical protein VGD14_17955 [bacterium]
MVALRIIKSPENGRIIIDLPVSLRREKKLEIIVLPFGTEQKQKTSFDPREFKGAGKLNMTVEEIDQECKKMRDEWERSF